MEVLFGRVATAALRRCLLAQRSIDVVARSMGAQACVHSRLLYLTGTWPDLAEVQLGRWCSEYCKPLRAVCGLHRPPVAGAPAPPPVSNAAVCFHLKVPPPEWALLASRLRLAIRIACRPASFLTAILRTSGGERWHRVVQNACAAMKELLPG